MKVFKFMMIKKTCMQCAMITAFLLVFPLYSFADCSDYQAVPPFLVADIPPNVLVVLDNSGSMNRSAYEEIDTETCSDSQAWTGYYPGTVYYGLFDSDRTYQYNNDDGKHFFEAVGSVVDDPATAGVIERAACLRAAPNNLWSGNWLNWFMTRRIDVAKKVLTGGKIAPDIDPLAADPSTAPSDDVVLEGASTLGYEIDMRRLYNDCAVGDDGINGCVAAGIEANKNVYYTPFHQGIYAFFDRVTRDDMGGTASQDALSVEIYKATFNDADELDGTDCVPVTSTDLTQDAAIFPVATTRGTDDLKLDGNSNDAFLVAVKIDDGDPPVTGIIQNLANDVRFGFMAFNYSAGGTVHVPIGDLVNEDEGAVDELGISNDQIINDPLTVEDPSKEIVFEIVNKINQQEIQMFTPLQEVLWEAGRYFQQYVPGTSTPITPLYAGSFETGLDKTPLPDEPAVSWDPYYFRDIDSAFNETYAGGYVPCAKSYIIFISDGARTMDDGVSTADWPNGANTNFRGDGSNYLDDIAFNLHTEDIRGDDVASIFKENINIDQNITLYAVFAFDTSLAAKAEMMRAARAGGFIDLNGDGDIGDSTNLGGYVSDTDPALFNSTRNGSHDKEWDVDGDNIPDTYFEASDGAEMEAALTEALQDIIQRTSSGSSLSVLSERATAGSVLHQALFFPRKNYQDNFTVDWSGTLNAYWFYTSKITSNIREDNVNQFYLDIFADNALDFRIDTTGNLNIDFYDLDLDAAMQDIIGTYSQVDDISKIFEAGTQLRDRAASSRTIYGVNESGVMEEFIPANYASFDSNFGATVEFPYCLGSALLGATDQTKAENLISYTRGAADDFTALSGSACRNRQVNNNTAGNTDGAGYRWKLGDIIQSSPTLVGYADRSMIYVASNDGILHAFEGGALRKDGLTSDQAVRICEKTTDCSQPETIGREAWAFIPQNVMPYLHFLADPNYQHIYTNDLSPYFINHGGKRIIIGGMRFGGGTGCVYGKSPKERSCGDPADDKQVLPPGFDPQNPSAARGLSSYYALDVTDPLNPKFLWEFNHPDLGLTYSGPAYIKRGGNTYVMFASGPLNYRGETNGDQGSVDGQGLKAFILKVDPITFELVDADGDGDVDADDSFKFSGADKIGYVVDSEFVSYNSAFGGRMFTDGIDWNKDGDTDLVFFGVNDANGTAGTVMGLVPGSAGTNHDPTDKITAGGAAETAIWHFDSVFESTTAPVVTKVVYGECFSNPFIYFGTGRWFYKDDNPGINVNDTEKLYGVLIRDCLADIAAGKTCSINYSNNSNTICDEVANLDDETTLGWVIDVLEPTGGSYLKERTTTDPTFGDGTDIVFFTTMQPSSKLCDFGGRSRMWAINCMSGDSIWGGCPGYEVDVPPGSLLLQLSGGNIEDAMLDVTDFGQEGNMASDWMIGIPPESSTPFVPFSGTLTGEIILWIER